MKLPFLISVPHAGTIVPPEVEGLCVLTEQEIIEDGDEGAEEIYFSLEPEVESFVATDIARAIVDMNRAEDDFSKDGVVKTHTCWGVPVYSDFPEEDIVSKLLEKYYRPYHARLFRYEGTIKAGIDCHTMAAFGPPVGPDPGVQRPAICLSNGNGTCSKGLLQSLAKYLESTFENTVAINDPFKGGYIIRSHSGVIPWVQIEISRHPFLTNAEKSRRLLTALHLWCAEKIDN
jgi:formiminoglutamase